MGRVPAAGGGGGTVLPDASTPQETNAESIAEGYASTLTGSSGGVGGGGGGKEIATREVCLDGKRNDQMAFHALADYQNHVIGWLQWEQSALGDGAVVRFPRIWMSSGECRGVRVVHPPDAYKSRTTVNHCLRGAPLSFNLTHGRQ